MAEIIGVRFKNTGKVYDFDPGDLHFEKGEYAIVETARGVECGEVVRPNREVTDAQLKRPLRSVLRKAEEDDVARMRENEARKKETLSLCQQRIRAHHLEMKLVDVEFSFDNSKILFYFTADGRVDFRDLVRDLASLFHTRIELRQIGVRDEAKMLGGIAVCGRPFCCAQFLEDFQPVSIKMAKEQGLSLNPAKISGSCGRLMCCLQYEQDAYEHLMEITPLQGDTVDTPQGRGVVQEVNLITGRVKVCLDTSPDAPPAVFDREELTALRVSHPEKPPEPPAGFRRDRRIGVKAVPRKDLRSETETDVSSDDI